MAQAFRPTMVLLEKILPEKLIRNKQMQLPFRAAKKHLAINGAKALMPSVHAKYPDKKDEDISTLPVSERVWHNPKISRRKAAVLRKKAKREGTYGSFNPENGQGWDPNWDVELEMNKSRGSGRFTALRPPKKTIRARTREDRARRIEAKLEGMDERIEELHAERIRSKPIPTFEQKYKDMRAKIRK